MRARVAVLISVLALVAGPVLTACSSDDKAKGGADASDTSSRLPTPTADVTEVTIPCQEFEGAATKIAKAQADLYSGASKSAEALVDELGALKAGAPASVRKALDDLADAFTKAAELTDKSTLKARAELAKLGPRFAAAGKKVTDYIVSKCRA